MANRAAPPSKSLVPAGTLTAAGWRRAPWAVAALAILPYLNTLSAALVLDDVFIVEENEQIRKLSNIPQLFVSHYWSGTSWIADRGLYRPLTMATYACNYALHGAHPAGYHVVNVLLHAAATLLLFVLLRRLFEDQRIALISAALFAVHPLHTEAVAGIVGRAEILAALGVFGSLYAYERARIAATGPSPRSRDIVGWIIAAVLCYAAGCFSKETGVVAPLLILTLELLRPERRWALRGSPAGLASFAGFAVVAAVYIGLRAGVIESAPEHPGWRGVPALPRIATALRLGIEYVIQTVVPWRLSADYWITDVPLARSLSASGTMAALAALLVAIVVIARTWRRQPALAFGLLAFAIALFPVSNLPFAIGVMKAERLMYTPSAGLLLATAAALAPLLRQPRFTAATTAGLVLVTLACGVRTVVRNFDWQTNQSLAAATLAVSPNSPMMNTNLGIWHRENGRLDDARYYVERAVAAEPQSGHARAVLGDLAMRAGRVNDAIAHFEAAVKLEPNLVPTLVALAEGYFAAQRWPDAARILERVRELRPDNPASYVNLAAVYLNIGDGENSLRVAEEGLRRFPDNGALHGVAAGAYEALGRMEEAQRARERAAQLGVRTGDPG